MHLVSTYRYPDKNQLALHDPNAINWVLGMLVQAPKIARDTAPFFWTILDAPRDGQIMLTWQPLQRLGTTFASDGYIWPGPDHFEARDLKNGLVSYHSWCSTIFDRLFCVVQILEVFTQRIGFRPGEAVATHARTRFRLVPAPVNVPGTPQVDASLWLIHYGPTQQPMPIDMLPIPPPMHTVMQQRVQIQRSGQITRKDFMLADRANWPQIPLPREGRAHPMMVQSGQARNVPQQMAYPPPSKRNKTAAHAQAQMVPIPAPYIAFDDEEDTSQGDMFDHLTPREVSMTRYTRNHEWMEEVLGSAYRIGQIVPADLGLGLQGELSSVTQGIFEASGVDAHKKPPTKPVVGHLDADLADQFRKRVADKLLADQSEMAKMKAQHEKRMAKFKANSILLQAEKELRLTVEESGPEFWRLEGKEENDEENTDGVSAQSHKKIDDIVAGVESALGRHIEVVSDVKRVQDGGYQIPVPEPENPPIPPAAPALADASGGGPGHLSRPPSNSGSQNSGVMVGDADVDMGGTATGLLDQLQPEQSLNPMPQAHLSAIPSGIAISANAAGLPPHTAAGQAAPIGISEDITMQDTDQAKDPNTAPDQGTESGDWIVVPKGGVSPGASASDGPAPPLAAAPSEPGQTPGDANKPAESDFGDMNTAGEAMSSYEQQNDGDVGDSMDMGMEDSAFGDAVYGVEESRGSAADTPADGGI